MELPDPDVALPDDEDPDEEDPAEDPDEEPSALELAEVEAGVLDELESLDDVDEPAESLEAVLVAFELLEPEPPRLSVL